MKNRKGFTLVEVIVAMVVLMMVVIALGRTSGMFVSKMVRNDIKTAAIQMAEDKVQAIQMEPVYDSIEAKYAKTELNWPGLPGISRVTQVLHVGGGVLADYKVITVTVSGTGLLAPLARTVVMGAP